MAVTVNTTRKAVEISWDPSASPGEPPDLPDAFPEHPIVLPPEGGEHPDHTLPGDLPHPDQGLPGDQPHPDQGLPGDQPSVEHPIYLPPYVDNSLPGAVKQALKEFLTGNLPPYEHPEPVASAEEKAVQVFAEGQDGDWSNTSVMPNDGLAVLSYPKDFTGESYVEVRALDGTLVDSGTITVK
jgi:hypothetical protein